MADTILYLCDRRTCEKCSPECRHTTDITHARNFELGLDGMSWIEVPQVIAFLEINTLLKKSDIQKIRNNIDEQMQTGVVLLPMGIKPVIASSDGTEHSVKFYNCGIDLSFADFKRDHPELSEEEFRERFWKHIF